MVGARQSITFGALLYTISMSVMQAPAAPARKDLALRLRVSARHQLPLRARLSFHLAALGEVLHVLLHNVEAPVRSPATYLAIDPRRGVIAQHPLPKIEDIHSVNDCQGALFLSTSFGSHSTRLMVLSSAGQPQGEAPLPTFGQGEHRAQVVCHGERSMAYWFEPTQRGESLAIAPLEREKLGEARRIPLPDGAHVFQLASGPQGLAMLGTHQDSEGIEGLLIDDKHVVKRLSLLTGSAQDVGLLAVADGWLLRYSRGDETSTRIEVQALRPDLTPIGPPLVVAQTIGHLSAVRSDGWWKSPGGSVVLGWHERVFRRDSFGAGSPGQPRPDITRVFARYSPQQHRLGPPLRVPDFGDYRGSFVGEKLVIVAPIARLPSALIIEPQPAEKGTP